MFILYFDSEYHEYFHFSYYCAWVDYVEWRAGEGAWLIPGTDPDDCFYSYRRVE